MESREVNFCIYDLAIYSRFHKILQYPLAVLFLIDYFLTHKQGENQVRGDIAMNVSSGSARILGMIGGLIRLVWRKRK